MSAAKTKPVFISPISAAFILGIRPKTLARFRNQGLLTSHLTEEGERYLLHEVIYDFESPLIDEVNA